MLFTSFVIFIFREPNQEKTIAHSEKNNNKDESVYENPNNMEAELISPRDAYSRIEESSSSKVDDDNGTYAIIPASSRPGQVVKNVLYHSYENTTKLPDPKQA